MRPQAAAAPAPGFGKVAHHLMREVNRSLLLDLLRSGGEMSRVDLARRTSLSKPTVSSIVEELVAEGLAREVGTRPSLTGGGRPPALLSYNESAEAYAGIQFGVHTTHVALADGRGGLLQQRHRPARPGDAERGILDAAEMVGELLDGLAMPRTRLKGAGVAVPGLVNSSTGDCPLAPNLGWRDVPVRSLVERALGVDASVHNSSLMAARAEGREGAAAAADCFVWVYAGTGIGAGIIDQRRPLLGDQGFSGEIGHSPVVDEGPLCACGNAGCLETVASTAAIVRAVEAAVDRGEPSSLAPQRGTLDAAAVTGAARAGDRLAMRVVEQAGDHLGRGISYLTNVLNPALVVVGGPLVQAGDVYLDAVRRSFRRHTLAAAAVPVVATRLGADAPLIGAVQTTLERRTASYRIVDARTA
jgi:glucokinase-like ROK family protein